MRLADFIVQNIEPILQQWEDFAKTMTPAADGMDTAALRDHAEQMLLTIAADLRTAQTHAARISKSHGEAPDSLSRTAAETHADTRQVSGFTIGQMIAEYRALRTSVLVLWMPPKGVTKDQEISDIIRFNEAIDQALAESVVTYTQAVDAARNVFLGILGHDLRSPLGAISVRWFGTLAKAALNTVLAQGWDSGFISRPLSSMPMRAVSMWIPSLAGAPHSRSEFR